MLDEDEDEDPAEWEYWIRILNAMLDKDEDEDPTRWNVGWGDWTDDKRLNW